MLLGVGLPLLEGGSSGDEFGAALSGDADHDGDGYADIVVGAPGVGGTGAAYLYLGDGSTIALAQTLSGVATDDGFGSALAAGDVDGDGLADLAVGAPGNDGAVYVYAGAASGLESEATAIEGTAGEEFGTSVALGDFDGNGYADLVIAGDGVESDHLLLFAGGASGFGTTPDWSPGLTDAAYDAVVGSPADADGDGAVDLPCATSIDWTEAGCVEPDEFREAGVYFGLLGSGASVLTAMDGASGVAFAGDVDGNGYHDLLVAFPDGAGSVSLRLLGPDADGDGDSPDFPSPLTDCDDADANVHLGAWETDGDGVDSDCDGEDDRPATTKSLSCPSFTTPEEAWPLAQDPLGGLGDPLDARYEVLTALGAADCKVSESGIDADGQVIGTSIYECTTAEDGLEATGRGFSSSISTSEDSHYMVGDCATTEVDSSTLDATLSLSTATASGVTGAQFRLTSYSYSSSDSGSYRSTRDRDWGTLDWDDGTTSTFYASVASASGTDSEACREQEESTSAEHGSCSLDVTRADGPCGDTQSWSVSDGTHSLTVDSLSEELCEGAVESTEVAWAVLDGVGSLVYSDGWAAVADTEYDGDSMPDELDCAPDDAAYTDPADAFEDADLDGYGNAALGLACQPGAGVVFADGDCDDGDPTVNPGADELCGPIDQDCDGYAEDGAVDAPSWYYDNDGDGYGHPRWGTAVACEQPVGWVANAEDCDDADPTVHPAAADDSADGIDQDCDGVDGPLDTGDPPAEDTAVEGDTAAEPSEHKDDPADGSGGSPLCGSLAFLVVLPLALRPRRR